MNNYLIFIIYLFILNILIIKGSTPRNLGNYNLIDITDTIDEIAKSNNQVYSSDGSTCSKVSYVLIQSLLPSIDTISMPYTDVGEMIQLNDTFFLFKTTQVVPVGDIQTFYINFVTQNGMQSLSFFEFDCKLPPNQISNQLVDNKIYQDKHYKGMYGILVKNLNVEKYLVDRGVGSFVKNTFDGYYVDNGNQVYLNVNYNCTIYNIRPTLLTPSSDTLNIKTKYLSVLTESSISIQPFLTNSASFTKPIPTIAPDTTCTNLKYDQCSFVFNVQVLSTVKYYFLMDNEIKRPVLVSGNYSNGQWYVQIDNIASRLSVGQSLLLTLYAFDTNQFVPQKNINTNYVGQLENNTLIYAQQGQSQSIDNGRTIVSLVIKIQHVATTNYGSMYLDGANYGYQSLIEIPEPFAKVSNNGDPTILNEFWIVTSGYSLSIGTHFGFKLHYPKYPTPLDISISPFNSYTGLVDSFSPEFINIEYFDGQNDCTVRITASDTGDSGIQLIVVSFIGAYSPNVTQYAIRITNQNLIEGDIDNGIYQITIPKYVIRRNYNIKLLDHASNLVQLSPNQFYSGSKYLPSFPYKFLGPLDVKSISFQWNNIDLSKIGKNNTMYITLVDETITNLIFQFIPSIGIDTYRSDQPMSLPNTEQFFTSTYNSITKQYEIPFYLPAHLPTGPISYLLNPLEIDSSTFYSYLGSSSELLVSSSETDILPPIVESILIIGDSKIPNIDNDYNNTIGFRITTTDSLNGIKKIILTVSSNLDFQGQSFTKQFSEPYQLNSILDVVWNVTSKSIPQKYTITKIITIDGQDNKAEYPNPYKVNPYFKIMESFDTTSILTTCQGNCLVIENVPPNLQKLSVTGMTITNYLQRTLSFNFVISDYGSGVNPNYLPTIYLISDQIEIISKKCLMLSGSSNNQFDNIKGVYIQIEFAVDITVPYLYGYPTGFMTQIHGIFDNNMNTLGLTPDKLAAYDHGVSFINVTIGQPEPSIVSATLSNLTSNAMLTITGFKFGISPTVYLNISSDGIYTTYQIPTPYITNGYIVIDPSKVRQNVDIHCSIMVYNPTSNTNSSYYNFQLSKIINIPITIPPTPTSSLPVLTPTPTLSSICKGEPQCGGSNKGICIQSICKCISPWFGIDCSSQLVTDLKPIYNSTQPEISIPYQPVNSNEIISSLISVYSLRELKYDGQIINEYIFNNWNHQINTNMDNYTYSITIINKNDNSKSTDIIVTIKQFEEKTTIEFAGQNITLQPSSIKYYIKISSYQFESNLNTLELVMYASIETSNSNGDNCIGSEIGDSNSQSVSEYVKVQINDKSLYGEFIKRALIDGKIGIVSNKILTSTNSIGSNSYIAIQIPNYSNVIEIDPNFSVLLDSRQVENSKCNDKSSGLTTSQLVGIIIGSIAFVTIILIVSFSIFYRKSTYLRVKAKAIRLKAFKNK